MPKSNLFSIGVDRLLQEVRPYGRDASIFPPELDRVDARRNSGETLHAWFVRLVDASCFGDPKRTAIEDNIAVFLKVGWKDKDQLVYANVQTIVTRGDLDDYYLTGKAEAEYLRLDFDYATLGEPFSHPLAHLHVAGDFSPRFALDGGNAGNVLVDFLEFLYRNYVSAKWLEWARRAWDDEFAMTAGDEDIDPFPKIVDAFASGQFQVLRDHAAVLAHIKRTLRRRKDDAFGLHLDPADREILEYPLAR